MPISGIMEDVKTSTSVILWYHKGSAEFFPYPHLSFFFLKLGVIYFREHKIYILTETGVQVAWSSETTG